MNDQELRIRRKAALEQLGWGAARSGVIGAAPSGFSIPGVFINDLDTYRKVFKAYFDRPPTDAEIKAILKRRTLGAVFVLRTVVTVRQLSQVLNPVTNPVTTEFAVAACAASTATGAAMFIAGCEYVWRSENSHVN